MGDMVKKRRMSLFLLACIPALAIGQPDSARYLWNAGAYNFGDAFFRSDAVDTLFLGDRQIFALNAAETTLIIPRFTIDAFEDSGGITVYPKDATVMWSFPRKFETQPDSYAYVTLGVAPDEFQISMEGTSPDNKDICFYSRRNINLGLKIPTQESGDYRVQVVEEFNNNQINAFQRIPLTIWSDRAYYGFGLAKFLDLRPGYPTMGHPRDSLIVMNIQVDTLFGAYGQHGSGYAKFIRAQILDTTKFEIDMNGTYRIAGGTEIRPLAVKTDTVELGHIVISSDQSAGKIYVNETGSFRISRYMPGLTSDHSCLLTLSGDNDEFITLKKFCKTDSLIIRGSGGYTGFIEYLVYRRAYTPRYQDESLINTPVGRSILQIEPVVTNRSARVRYSVPYAQYIGLNLYDAVGRRVSAFVNNIVDAGMYSFDLDFTGLSQGLYFLRLETGNVVSCEKVVFVR
jgi:hypothetical protein